MKIYLCRHGEVEHNRLKYYSNADEDLNDTGIAQAFGLRDKLRSIDYGIIYTSPLIRAVHTAEILNYKNRLIVSMEGLSERNPMKLNGLSIDVTDREEYWNYYSNVDYGAEDIQSFFGRVFRAIDVIKTSTFKSVIVVAHSGVSKAFYGYFHGIPKDGKLLNLGLKNCEVVAYTVG